MSSNRELLSTIIRLDERQVGNITLVYPHCYGFPAIPYPFQGTGGQQGIVQGVVRADYRISTQPGQAIVELSAHGRSIKRLVEIDDVELGEIAELQCICNTELPLQMQLAKLDVGGTDVDSRGLQLPLGLHPVRDTAESAADFQKCTGIPPSGPPEMRNSGVDDSFRLVRG